MSLNPFSNATNRSWNYSNPNKEGYSESLTGTVVAIQEIQARSFSNDGKPGVPLFWPQGDPKFNIRMTFVKSDGSIVTFTFQPASNKAKDGKVKSIHFDLWKLTGKTNIMNLIGKTITIKTTPGTYGAGNPRPWEVSLSDEGPFQPNEPIPAELTQPKIVSSEAASGGQLNNQQQQQQVPMQTIVQPMTQPVQVQPMVQPVAQPVQYSQPQVVMQQPNVQSIPNVQMKIPDGMDPNVAAAMQAVSANNVQPVAQSSEVYSDIPF